MPKHRSHNTHKVSGNKVDDHAPYAEKFAAELPPREVEVLRIPADGSDLKIYTLDTIELEDSNSRTVDAHTQGLERQLGHVPDLERFSHSINLDHRCLFNREIAHGGKRTEWDGEYHLYKNIGTTGARLPENEYFKKFGDKRVFGDAFVFRVTEIREFDSGSKACFGDMQPFAHKLLDQHYRPHTPSDLGDLVRNMAKW